MDTVVKSNQKSIVFKAEKIKAEAIAKFWDNAESNRFGITPVLLVIIACLGGVAGASGILESWIKLAAVAFPATLSLAMILSVAPMRVIYTSTAIAIILDVLVLIF